ncbi:MAG: hypothetical protein CM1200mP3_07700 [Chloroflexota bacterium]|nr:MAG: hypothetical protein CM1200mP3_07700 [Chloroflexota bacterium]
MKNGYYCLATDLDGDRLTDFWQIFLTHLKGFFGGKVADHIGTKVDMNELWNDMGYSTGNGRDMTSVYA